MCDSALQEIANDICARATEIFSQQERVNDKKWILVREENNDKGKAMECIDTEYSWGNIGITADILCKNYENLIKNINVIQTLLEIEDYRTKPERIVGTLLRDSFDSLTRSFNSNTFFRRLSELTDMIINNNSYEITLIGDCMV